MTPIVSTSSLRQSIVERFSTSMKDATIAPKLYEKRGIDPSTARLKKSPSLLFRLWDAAAQSPQKPFRLPEEETTLIAAVEEILADGFGPHPLQPYYAPSSKIKKQRENLLHEASILRFWGIIHDDTVMVDMSGSPGDGSAADSRVVPETVAPDMIAGRRWEGDFFKECGKNVSPRIGFGEINIDEFPTFREDNNCLLLLQGAGFRPPKSLEGRERVVSWTDSFREYAGALGHVFHSGERPVSDCFRSLTTRDFGEGNVAPDKDIGPGEPVRRIPTLRLPSRTGFGQRPQFEQDHENLMNDWETAMRLMEESPSAERPGSRLKRKKKILGIRDKGISKGKSPAEGPLDHECQESVEHTDVKGDIVYSSREDLGDHEELDSGTEDEH